MRRIWCLTIAGFIGGLANCPHVGRAADKAPARNSGWELTAPAPNAQPVAAASRLPGIYPAGSRIKDKKALPGFGTCNNWPNNLGEKTWGAKGAISLVAFPDQPVAYFKDRIDAALAYAAWRLDVYPLICSWDGSRQMAVRTTRVAGRRHLRFASLDDVLADAEHLAVIEIRQLGNWTLGQILSHLAAVFEKSIDGTDFRPGWFLRVATKLAGPLLKRWARVACRPEFARPHSCSTR